MLWSMMVRVVIHAEAFVRIRVAIDIRIVRYVVAATAGLVILKGPQDHLSRTKPLEADLAALRKEASLLHE